MGRYSDSIIKTVLEANDLEDTLEIEIERYRG